MNVGELKKLIADIPDDVEIFIESSGHEMMMVSVSDWKVNYHRKSRTFWQHFDEDTIGDDEFALRALVVE